jgi:hypothetical protein
MCKANKIIKLESSYAVRIILNQMDRMERTLTMHVFGMRCIIMQFLTYVSNPELITKTSLSYCEGKAMRNTKKGVNYEEE